MAVSSIGSSVASGYALAGIASATARIENSVAKISSGNRLTRAGDDVAALSIVARMRSSLAANRQAKVNNAQADSLLQVAYGGLNSIGSILDSMAALAVTANDGSLTPAQSAVLDAQFQQYVAQIDSIATNTNFNGKALLDGSANAESAVAGKTNRATQATGSLNFAVNIGAGQTVVLNGVTFTEGVGFAAGGSINASLNNLANALNTSTNTSISQATYSVVGNTLNIAHDSGGTLGNQFLISQAGSTAAFTTTGGTTNVANVFTLQGGANDGLNLGSVKSSGTVGDTLVTAQSQTGATSRLSITGAIAAGEQLQIDNANGGTVNFRFTNAVAATTDILIGATTSDTIANAVAVISRYTATDDFGVRQLDVTRDGTDLVLTNKLSGNPGVIAGAPFNLTETLANGSLSAATLAAGTNTGIDASGVNNSAFIGTVSGFTATYNSADNLTAQITVGGATYSSTITDTTPAANTTTRFTSASGGYFDVQLAGGLGQTVNNQADANTYAARLDAAFSGLDFTQNRFISSYTAAGQLANSSLEVQLGDFTDLTLNDISALAPSAPGLDAVIDITLNGEVFRSAPNVGGTIGDYESLKFTSLTDGNHSITFRNGNTAIDLSTQAAADTFETNLKTALGFGVGSGSISLQVGESATDRLDVRISSVLSSKLFNGATPDLLNPANAVIAQGIIDTAIDSVTAVSTDVGTYQARLGFINDYLDTNIQATDEARAQLEETDIPTESTELAAATVLQQAGIAVLAQVQSLSSNLLSLLQKNT